MTKELLEKLLKVLERAYDFNSIKSLIEEKEQQKIVWKPNSTLAQYQEAYEVYQQLKQNQEQIFWTPRGYLSKAKIKPDDIKVLILEDEK